MRAKDEVFDACAQRSIFLLGRKMKIRAGFPLSRKDEYIPKERFILTSFTL